MIKNNIVSNNVFKYFYELSKIPRSSGNEKAIGQYLINFAKTKNLTFYQDEYNNVIIYKKTSNKEPIILQAHTDMVCVKSQKSMHDFNLEGIKTIRKGNWLSAINTSLGADDGIGVALILDILDSVKECNIEAVFTSSEETTMQGAYNLNIKKLSSKNMISLDGFEENTLLTSSASFIDYYITINNNKVFVKNSENLKTFKLILSGLEGGHSGFDIDKNRGNSHKLITELLLLFDDLIINDFSGGHNYNIIPSKSEVIFSTTKDDKTIKNIIKNFYKQYKLIYKGLKISCNRQLNKTLVLQDSKNFLSFIKEFKNGVINKDENNFVLSSQNLSEINTEQGYIKIGLRSNLKKYEEDMVKSLKMLCDKYNFNGKVLDSQPSFNTLENSILIQKLKQANPLAICTKKHMAVESGIFQDRIKKLDVVIISPTIIDAHSISEKLYIPSVVNTLNWLKKFLEIY